METANTVILDALQLLVVQADEAPIEASEAQTAIRHLNRMMYRFDAEGISLGFNVIENLGDVVTVPIGALDGVVYNLAISIAPHFEVPVSIDIAKLARDSKEAMRALSFRIGQTELPSTLPIGSGHSGCRGGNEFKFYSGHRNKINTETNRDIIQEDRNVLNDECINNDNEEADD